MRSLRRIAVSLVAALIAARPAAALARPGDLTWSGAIAAPAGAHAWRIRYESTGLDGKPIPVTGLLYAPASAAPPAGRPVIAWAHPTTGVAEKCAVSLDPAGSSGRTPDLADLLERGYVVVATDYPGLGTPGPHPYLVGVSEARAVLDSVRAAQHVPAAAASRRFVAWGHSQGGHAVLFVGQIAASYAPDLSLLGVAAVSPPTDLETLLQENLPDSTGRILASYAVWSWSHVYDYGLDGAVRKRAIPIVNGVARDCLESKSQAYAIAFASATLTPRFVLPQIYTTPPWSATFSNNSPTQMPQDVPLFVAQGESDTIVKPAVTAAYVARACARGQRVAFDRFDGGHMGAGATTYGTFVLWAAHRFAGDPVPSTCPSTRPTSPP